MIAESETPVLVDFYAVWYVVKRRTPRCEARCTAGSCANHLPGQTATWLRCLYHSADCAPNCVAGAAPARCSRLSLEK